MKKKITNTVGCLLTIFVTAIIVIAIINKADVDKTPYVVDVDPNIFTKQWMVAVDNPIVSTLIINDGKLIVQTTENIMALDIDEGQLIWSLDLKGKNNNHPPVSYDNHLFAFRNNGSLVAIDSVNGDTEWYDDDCSQDNMSSLCYHMDDALIYQNSNLITAGYEKPLISYDLYSREIIWKQYLGGRCSAELSIYHDKLIYTCTDKIFVLNRVSGVVLDEITFDDGINDIFISNEKLIVMHASPADKTTFLKILDPNDLSLLGTINIDYFGARRLCDSSGNTYLSGDGLIQVDLTTGELMQFPIKEELSCPIVYKTILIVRKWTGNYLVYDAITRELISTLGANEYTKTKSNPIDPIIYKDWIFAPIGINHIIALSLK